MTHGTSIKLRYETAHYKIIYNQNFKLKIDNLSGRQEKHSGSILLYQLSYINNFISLDIKINSINFIMSHDVLIVPRFLALFFINKEHFAQWLKRDKINSVNFN